MKKVKLIYAGCAALCLSSCAKDDNVADFKVNKPDTVALIEQLNSYGTLLDYAGQLKVGNTLSMADFNANGAVSTLTKKNFSELTLDGVFSYAKLVNESGSIDTTLTDINTTVAAAKEAKVSIYGQSLLDNNVQKGYLMDGFSTKMSDDVTNVYTVDFEDKKIGDTYPIACNGEANDGTAEVVDDPDGVSGKCLYVKCGLAMPVIEVNLPDEAKFNSCVRIEMDFRAVNEGALTGFANAFHFRVNAGTNKSADYPVPSEQGCVLGEWGRGKVVLDLTRIQLDGDDGKMTTLPLEIGTVDWGVEYYMDNIKIYYHPYVTDFTGTASKNRIDGEIKRYVQTVLKTYTGIPAWTIAENPVSLGEEDIFWKKVMGTDYVNIAAKHAHAVQKDLNLFVSESGLDDAENRQALASLLKSASDVNGVNAVLALTDETDFDGIFSDLASTGKLVRLSVVSFASSGVLLKAVNSYMQKVPQGQRYGISFAKVDGIWTSGDFNRTRLYKDFCDA